MNRKEQARHLYRQADHLKSDVHLLLASCKRLNAKLILKSGHELAPHLKRIERKLQSYLSELDPLLKPSHLPSHLDLDIEHRAIIRKIKHPLEELTAHVKELEQEIQQVMPDIKVNIAKLKALEEEQAHKIRQEMTQNLLEQFNTLEVELQIIEPKFKWDNEDLTLIQAQSIVDGDFALRLEKLKTHLDIIKQLGTSLEKTYFDNTNHELDKTFAQVRAYAHLKSLMDTRQPSLLVSFLIQHPQCLSNAYQYDKQHLFAAIEEQLSQFKTPDSQQALNQFIKEKSIPTTLSKRISWLNFLATKKVKDAAIYAQNKAVLIALTTIKNQNRLKDIPLNKWQEKGFIPLIVNLHQAELLNPETIDLIVNAKQPNRDTEAFEEEKVNHQLNALKATITKLTSTDIKKSKIERIISQYQSVEALKKRFTKSFEDKSYLDHHLLILTEHVNQDAERILLEQLKNNILKQVSKSVRQVLKQIKPSLWEDKRFTNFIYAFNQAHLLNPTNIEQLLKVNPTGEDPNLAAIVKGEFEALLNDLHLQSNQQENESFKETIEHIKTTAEALLAEGIDKTYVYRQSLELLKGIEHQLNATINGKRLDAVLTADHEHIENSNVFFINAIKDESLEDLHFLYSQTPQLLLKELEQALPLFSIEDIVHHLKPFLNEGNKATHSLKHKLKWMTACHSDYPDLSTKQILEAYQPLLKSDKGQNLQAIFKYMRIPQIQAPKKTLLAFCFQLANKNHHTKAFFEQLEEHLQFFKTQDEIEWLDELIQSISQENHAHSEAIEGCERIANKMSLLKVLTQKGIKMPQPHLKDNYLCALFKEHPKLFQSATVQEIESIIATFKETNPNLAQLNTAKILLNKHHCLDLLAYLPNDNKRLNIIVPLLKVLLEDHKNAGINLAFLTSFWLTPSAERPTKKTIITRLLRNDSNEDYEYLEKLVNLQSHPQSIDLKTYGKILMEVNHYINEQSAPLKGKSPNKAMTIQVSRVQFCKTMARTLLTPETLENKKQTIIHSAQTHFKRQHTFLIGLLNLIASLFIPVSIVGYLIRKSKDKHTPFFFSSNRKTKDYKALIDEKIIPQLDASQSAEKHKSNQDHEASSEEKTPNAPKS